MTNQIFPKLTSQPSNLEKAQLIVQFRYGLHTSPPETNKAVLAQLTQHRDMINASFNTAVSKAGLQKQIGRVA